MVSAKIKLMMKDTNDNTHNEYFALNQAILDNGNLTEEGAQKIDQFVRKINGLLTSIYKDTQVELTYSLNEIL